ncbi:MAG: two pore domain potassium channel family protein [Pseudomonadales bacterium]|jgi:hypothetical protein|nr:two pore domain potassium channel family protein [Pseudomonadales bacterium]
MTIAVIVNCIVIAIVVLVHYEALRHLFTWIPRLPIARRLRVVVAVFGALVAHALEVWIFAGAFYWYINTDGLGVLVGNFSGTFLDCVYFSFTNYTSLGYGDIEPLGHIRFLAGLEGLVGLVMIGWTASFIYVEMTRFWREPDNN